MLASPSPPAPPSPSSSSVSARKKISSAPKQKPLPPKSSSSCKPSSPMAAQDEIEIEIAEVLYGMMRQPMEPSKQETAVNESRDAENVNPGAKSTGDLKSPISNSPYILPQSSVTLATNSSSSNGSATAPKRKRPRPVKYEDENNSVLPSGMSSISSTVKAEADAPSKISGSTEENSSVLESTSPAGISAPPPLKADRGSKPSLESRSMVKKDSSLTKDESVSTKMEGSSGVRSDGDGVVTIAAKAILPSPEKEKLKIDLMAPPPARSSPERDGEKKCVVIEVKPKATDVETENAKPLPKENDSNAEKSGCKEDSSIREPDGKKPRKLESEFQKSEMNTELKLDLETPGAKTVSTTGLGLNKLNHHHVQKQTQQQMPCAEKAAQASHLPLHMSMAGWPGGLPTMGCMAPTQGVVPMDSSSLPSATMQPPHLFFNQPRPKKCATHCYIARNIHYHQQFMKMNPFWPAAGSASLYGAKACNPNPVPSTELQGNVLGRTANSASDKSSQSINTTSETSQRTQILLQQALPPGAPSNILHGPAFIFPLGQQPHAASAIAAASVRPPVMSGNTASSAASASSSSVNGSAPAPQSGATTMSFSYPNMPGNETQYLAILPNNGYPFPVPAHIGAPPPAYRGVSGQPIPFFSGPFYSSQMIHPPPHLQPQQQQSGQGQQGQASSNNQITSLACGSSAAQKQFQNQQQRPPMNPGNPQGFPTSKVQSSQPLSFQQRQQQPPRENTTQQSGTAMDDSPSTADSRLTRSNVAYGQKNFAMPMQQPTNLGLMNSAASGGAVAASEKKPQRQGSKASDVESLQSQAYAMAFATFNGANPPGLNMPAIAQNHAIFHSLPEAAAAARQGYHQVMAAAQPKMNYNPPEDGKSRRNATANAMEERKTGGTGKTTQSIAFSSKPDLADESGSEVTGSGAIDSSAGLLNLGPAPPRTCTSMQNSHHQQQQQYTIYLQKQQQYATAAAAGSAAKSKGSVTSNGSVFPDHRVGGKFLNANSGFPQNHSQWKNSSSRTNPTQVLPSSAAPSLKSVAPKQQGRPQQGQISFAGNSKSLMSGPPIQQSQSPPMLVGSPSTSSVSKNVGSPRTTTSASSQPSKNPQTASVHNSSASSASAASGGRNGNGNGPSVLGNPNVTPPATSGAGSKPQVPPHQQQQGQLFFSNHYIQPPQQQSVSGYYLQRHQQQLHGSSPAATAHSQTPPVAVSSTTITPATSDPAKAIAVAAAAAMAANNMKGGNLAVTNSSGPYGSAAQLPPPGKTHHQLVVPPGFPYVHAVPSAVPVKPADQKQQAGE
ncbi:PREDICTED: protein TIME FOR COFFEE-like isoform X3 [Tarenaya hassleriana]|nr:PREDICTED: protein TIME FOR COFFEE-like isoform X3 [Tarenaya hassleriana]